MPVEYVLKNATTENTVKYFASQGGHFRDIQHDVRAEGTDVDLRRHVVVRTSEVAPIGGTLAIKIKPAAN